MERFEQKRLSRYPHVIKSWRTNWGTLTTFFRYPFEIRRVMHTTNIIESVNSKFWKATGARRVFPSDEAVLKCLYMAALDLEKKWTRPIQNWSTIYAQLVLLFEDRVLWMIGFTQFVRRSRAGATATATAFVGLGRRNNEELKYNLYQTYYYDHNRIFGEKEDYDIAEQEDNQPWQE